MSTAIAVKSSGTVGYLMVSTMSQAGERHVSLETQESALRVYCTRNGLTLMATFSMFRVAVVMTALNTRPCSGTSQRMTWGI